MWFLDGRTVNEVITACKRPDPIPLEEWDRLVNPLEGAGLIGSRGCFTTTMAYQTIRLVP